MPYVWHPWYRWYSISTGNMSMQILDQLSTSLTSFVFLLHVLCKAVKKVGFKENTAVAKPVTYKPLSVYLVWQCQNVCNVSHTNSLCAHIVVTLWSPYLLPPFFFSVLFSHCVEIQIKWVHRSILLHRKLIRDQ